MGHVHWLEWGGTRGMGMGHGRHGVMGHGAWTLGLGMGMGHGRMG